MRIQKQTVLVGAMELFFTGIASADTLSINEFVRIALRNNPQQKIAASVVASKSASVATARSSLLPQVNGTAGISRSGSPATLASKGKNSASAEVDASALIYDFGAAPYHYKASGKYVEAARYDSQSTMASLILNARTAYYNYLLSKMLLIVNEDALEQANIHFNQATILFKVGKQAQIEVTKARVDVANAEVKVIHAKNAIDLAKIQMEVVAGVSLGDPLVLVDSLGAREDSLGVEDALARAMQKRPEMSSLLAGVEAAALDLKAARAAYLPSLRANGNVNWNANDDASFTASDFSGVPGWGVGADLSVPIYQGGKISALVQQADADLQQVKAQLDALKLTVAQQVRQYFLQEKEALQQISATKTLIEQAQESLRLSQERFRAGVAFSIEVTDAEVTLADARASYAQAQFDYHVAHTNLLLATGGLNE